MKWQKVPQILEWFETFTWFLTSDDVLIFRFGKWFPKCSLQYNKWHIYSKMIWTHALKKRKKKKEKISAKLHSISFICTLTEIWFEISLHPPIQETNPLGACLDIKLLIVVINRAFTVVWADRGTFKDLQLNSILTYDQKTMLRNIVQNFV